MRHLIDRRKRGPDKVRTLKAEQKRVSREKDNLVALAISGSVPKTIKQEIEAREQRLETIKREIDAFSVPDELNELDERRTWKACQKRMGRFKDLIYSNVPLARQALRKLLPGPIYFAPMARLEDHRKTFRFDFNVDAGPLLNRTLTTLASPTGLFRTSMCSTPSGPPSLRDDVQICSRQICRTLRVLISLGKTSKMKGGPGQAGTPFIFGVPNGVRYL